MGVTGGAATPHGLFPPSLPSPAPGGRRHNAPYNRGATENDMALCTRDDLPSQPGLPWQRIDSKALDAYSSGNSQTQHAANRLDRASIGGLTL